jgi:16S rRNA (guanine527-N7)-methyltransferase
MSGDARTLFAERFDVSRETLDRLDAYEALIRKWNPAINLVSKTTLDDLWARHFMDSAQTLNVTGAGHGRWVDLGSGGGFPGAVIALVAAEKAPDLSVTCIESDIRKCEFIRTVARTTGVPIKVMSRRIEEAPPQDAQYVSARALAPLSRLLSYVDRHLNAAGTAVLHKGEHWRAEVEDALESWRFSYENHPSPINPTSSILTVKDLARA